MHVTDYQSGDLSILPFSIMSNTDPLKNASIRMDAVDHVLGGTSTIVSPQGYLSAEDPVSATIEPNVCLASNGLKY